MAECPRVDGKYPFALRTRREKRLNRALTAFVRAIFPPILRLVFGFRVEGREHLAALSGGAVSVCNHVHALDCVMLGCACPHRPVRYLSLRSNFEIPVIGRLIRWLGAVPVPETPSGYAALHRYVADLTGAGGLFQVYPEGWLEPRCGTLRAFHRGAFDFACTENVPVLPMVLTQTPWRGIRALWHRKPAFTLHILQPVWPEAGTPLRTQSVRLEQTVRAAMADVLDGSGPFADEQPDLQPAEFPPADPLPLPGRV